MMNYSLWKVTYTKQKVQKTKLYHDGILTLKLVASSQRKAILSTEDGAYLDEMFLGRNDEVENGKILEFPFFLVDVCGSLPDGDPLSNLNQGVKSARNVEVAKESTARKSSHYYKKARNASTCQPEIIKNNAAEGETGETSSLTSIEEASKESLELPFRNVSQILECLKRPQHVEYGRPDKYESSKITQVLNLEKKAAVPTPNAEKRIQLDKHYSNQFALKSLPKGSDGPKKPFAKQLHNLENHIKSSWQKLDSMCKRPQNLLKQVKGFQNAGTTSSSVTSLASLQQSSIVFQADMPPPKRRKVLIPSEFPSIDSYQASMSLALIEEINLIVAELANHYSISRKKLFALTGPKPSCKHGLAKLQVTKKEGPNLGRMFYICPSYSSQCLFLWADSCSADSAVKLSMEEMAKALSVDNIDFYWNCDLFMRHTTTAINHITGKNVEGLSYEGVLLKLTERCKKSAYSRGDLWIISSNVNFKKDKGNDLLLVAASVSHGTFSNGAIQLQIVGDKEVLTNCKNVYALRGSRITSELAMLENIRNLHPASMPILQLLLNSSKTSSHQVPLDVETFELANEAIAKYSLNEDQAKVLNTVANWFSLSGNDSTIDSSNPEFCLVHGPFGSGKSHLLVILVVFLSELLERRSDFSTRILVSAATNVAVDRILTGLLKHGFTKFLRVGSLKMIAKNILPYSLQVACKGDDDEMGPGIHTQQTDEKLKEQKKRLNMVRVVGVTCFSTTKAVFEGSRFKVCLLDECSQIPEPLSLLPLCGFGCEKLVAVGDPAQLPPLLSGGCGITDSKASQNYENAPWDTHLYNDPEHDSDKILQGFSANLTRPLFVRLVAMGHEPVLLRTQYRCHPRLARISNNLFYNGQLKNGCSEVQRLPLVEGLPPLLFFETRDLGREVRDNLNSYCNLYEAKLACQLVTHLLKKGVLGNQIGVIVLYKSQACLVQKLFSNQKDAWQSTGSCIKIASRVRKSKELKILKEGPCLIEDVQVSTVDAFQGMEKDVIILSCCRTNALGFLSSPNRVNVALTRARHHLIIIGKAENLRKSWFWRELVATVQSTPGAHESASRLITDFQRAMEENGRTISQNCEEDYLQIQDLNQDPRKSKNTPHVMASTTRHSLRSQILPDFPSKYQQGELRSSVSEKSKKHQKSANKRGTSCSYGSLSQASSHIDHVECEDFSTEIAETNSFFADKEPDKVHKVINDWQKSNSGAQEVTRNHANCYSEQCLSELSISRSKGGNEEFGKVAVQSEVSQQGRPEVPGALPICSVEMEETLDELSFRAIDFWDGYKLYCIGHYSHSAEHKLQFLQSKMGRALCKLYGELKLFRGASFDEIVRQAWSMMEDYVKSRYGEDCKNIWTLIKAYDNLEELAATEYGNFFLQIAEEESSRAESSQTMVDKITDGDEEEIFYQLRQQLGKMDNRIQHLEGRGPMSKDDSIESSTASVQEHSKRAVNFNAGDDAKNRTCGAVVSERIDCDLEVSCLSENTGWNW